MEGVHEMNWGGILVEWVHEMNWRGLDRSGGGA